MKSLVHFIYRCDVDSDIDIRMGRCYGIKRQPQTRRKSLHRPDSNTSIRRSAPERWRLPDKTANVHYTGWLENGKKFDSSVDRGQPFSFPLGAGRVIKGLGRRGPGDEGGGKRKLTIPSDLGYGSRGAGGVIPPNATLIFDVELLAVR